MRKILVLLILILTTGIIGWNTIDGLVEDNYLIEEGLSEESEFENQEGEKELEELDERTLELFFNLESTGLERFASIPRLLYRFTISTFCLEPEINPPRG